MSHRNIFTERLLQDCKTEAGAKEEEASGSKASKREESTSQSAAAREAAKKAAFRDGLLSDPTSSFSAWAQNQLVNWQDALLRASPHHLHPAGLALPTTTQSTPFYGAPPTGSLVPPLPRGCHVPRMPFRSMAPGPIKVVFYFFLSLLDFRVSSH